MNLHFEDIEIDGLKVRRIWFDDEPPSSEASALMSANWLKTQCTKHPFHP